MGTQYEVRIPLATPSEEHLESLVQNPKKIHIPMALNHLHLCEGNLGYFFLNIFRTYGSLGIWLVYGSTSNVTDVPLNRSDNFKSFTGVLQQEGRPLDPFVCFCKFQELLIM